MSQRRLLASLQAPFLKDKKGVCYSTLYLQKKRNLLVLDHSHQQVSYFSLLVQLLSGSTYISWIPDESIVVSGASSKGTGSKPGVPDEEKPFREDKCLIRRENQCFIVLLSGALFQPHRRRDILSFMSITKRVFKGVEIFDQRGTYWYDKYDNSSRKKSVHLGLSCLRFGRHTSSLLNANCKKALNLLRKGLLVQGEAKTTSKQSVSRQTEHLKMEMEIPCSNKIKFVTAYSFSNDTFEDIMKAQVSIFKASTTLNIQAFKIKKSVSISFRMTQVHKMAKDHMMMIRDYYWMMISKKLKDHIQVKLKPKSLKFTASNS
ncbi:retrovirus-related pol polyprotein from transposon TNT 1-94 [Tanacetum coccineum]